MVSQAARSVAMISELRMERRPVGVRMSQRGVVDGEPQDHMYWIRERSRRTAQTWVWTDQSCPMDPPHALFL